MAKIFYELRQNKNNKSQVFGRWFAHSKSIETLNTRKLAKHISEHGSVYTQDVVFGVLEKFRSCLVEMLLESKRVKIDGLGTFFTTLENEAGGAIKKDDFNVGKNLKALHIRFMPEQEQEMNISSREFLKKAEFVNAETLVGGNTSSSENSNSNPSTSQGGSSSSGGNLGGDSQGGNQPIDGSNGD